MPHPPPAQPTPPPPRPPGREVWLRRLGGLFLAFWIPFVLVAVASVMSSHVVALPEPEDPARLVERSRHALGGLPDDPDGWRVHLVPDRCSCTEGLLRHLLARRDVQHEALVFLGHRADLREPAEDAGYRYLEEAPEVARDTWGLPAAPVLVIGEGTAVRYVGGYYDAPATVHPRTARILQAVHAGRPVTPLPVFGCAVDAELQQRLDPLGLRRLQ